MLLNHFHHHHHHIHIQIPQIQISHIQISSLFFLLTVWSAHLQNAWIFCPRLQFPSLKNTITMTPTWIKRENSLIILKEIWVVISSAAALWAKQVNQGRERENERKDASAAQFSYEVFKILLFEPKKIAHLLTLPCSIIAKIFKENTNKYHICKRVFLTFIMYFWHPIY